MSINLNTLENQHKDNLEKLLEEFPNLSDFVGVVYIQEKIRLETKSKVIDYLPILVYKNSKEIFEKNSVEELFKKYLN